MKVDPSHMKWSESETFADYLRSRNKNAKPFHIDFQSYLRLLKEAARLHPAYTKEQRVCWALYSAASRARGKYISQEHVLWMWRACIMLELLALIIIGGCSV